MARTKLDRAVGRTRYLRDLVSSAEDILDDIFQLCGDMHDPKEPCSFCDAARRIKRVLPRAIRQLNRIGEQHVREAVNRPYATQRLPDEAAQRLHKERTR